jgi:hypothetical protein
MLLGRSTRVVNLFPTWSLTNSVCPASLQVQPIELFQCMTIHNDAELPQSEGNRNRAVRVEDRHGASPDHAVDGIQIVREQGAR